MWLKKADEILLEMKTLKACMITTTKATTNYLKSFPSHISLIIKPMAPDQSCKVAK